MKVTQAIPHSGFQLELHFDNGESGLVDLQEFVGRGVFSAWERPGVFEQVAVTSDGAVNGLARLTCARTHFIRG